MTKKWMHILPLLKTLPSSAEDDTASHNDDTEDAAFEDSFQHATWLNKNNDDGDGIQFLPGDIKGLETKLNCLLGKYRAGNRSSLTRNQIVSILDDLDDLDDPEKEKDIEKRIQGD